MFNWFFKKKEPDIWVGTVSLGWYETPKGPIVKTTYLQLFEREDETRYVQYSIEKDLESWYIYPYKSHNLYNKHVLPWLHNQGIDIRVFSSYNEDYFEEEKPVKITQEDNVFFINKEKQNE